MNITELLEEKANHIYFWQTSTDVVIPAESPHSYKGTARHIIKSGLWDLVGSNCPRCDDGYWHGLAQGMYSCSTHGCNTWKQGKVSLSRANENINNPPMTGNIMSEPREADIQEEEIDFDSIPFFDYIPAAEGVKTGGKKYE
tara:strand:- start:7037 stop:7462 length:426 start_codon:yes stop_codon:yes gene_type:complete